MATIEVKVPDIGDFNDVPVIEVLVRSGRIDQDRTAADHARIGQGDHGRAVAARWRGEGKSRSRPATNFPRAR